LLLRYGGVEDDPEAVPPLPQVPPPQVAVPLAPPPPAASPPAAVVRLSGWPLSAEEAARRQAGAGAGTRMEVELGAGVKMELVLIPAGEFVMGEPAGYLDEMPQSAVRVDRPFWIGKTEVTNEQYRCFDPSHDSGVEPMLWLKWHPGHLPPLSQPLQPVCRVSWEEAKAFCRWLSEKSGKKFSLPDEAEWEWACRAGTDTAWGYGPMGSDLAAFANIADASLLQLGSLASLEKVRPFFAVDPTDDKSMVSAPVGSYRPNRWGLCDMHGNVAEWTGSAYLAYPFRAGDPAHAAPGARKVVRGGSWRQRADLARSSCRTSYWPWQRVFDVGFRVVCEAE
jgi:formylglycine-generating enzyme required for sulfatase activity